MAHIDLIVNTFEGVKNDTEHIKYRKMKTLLNDNYLFDMNNYYNMKSK